MSREGLVRDALIIGISLCIAALTIGGILCVGALIAVLVNVLQWSGAAS